MICLSEGTATCLGLKKIRMADAPTTAYLLFGEHCIMDCAFCPQARGNANQGNTSVTDAGGRDKNGTIKLLGRVTWPTYPPQQVLEGLKSAAENGLKRICIQGVKSASGHEDLLWLIEQVKEVSSLPVCISAWVEREEEAALFFRAGAERVSIALDLVNPRSYARYKKGSLQRRCELLFNCARRWPGRMSTHLIMGLGETEEETITLLDKLLGADIGVALFAFTPLKGTALVAHPAPSLGSYRRIQAARFLMLKGLVCLAVMDFRDGRLCSFGLTGGQLQEYLRDGEAFQTSGCPNCNRPYFNERPGGTIYNYPRPLTAEEAKAAIYCLGAANDIKKETLHDRTLARHL